MGNTVNDHNSAMDLKKAIARRLSQVIFQYVVLAAMLFIFAGKLDWRWAWAYLGAGFGILLFNMLIFAPRNPELVAERSQVKEDTKDWDRTITRIILVFTLMGIIVAGLDARFAWTPPLPVWVHILGLVLFAGGQLLFTWSMMANKYFATTVRIQEERQHIVAVGGPYRYIRHPGYVGMSVSMFGTPFALGSLWMLIPYGLGVLGYLIRTALEDKTLKSELPGYAAYAQKVRYRLIPGIW